MPACCTRQGEAGREGGINERERGRGREERVGASHERQTKKHSNIEEAQPVKGTIQPSAALEGLSEDPGEEMRWAADRQAAIRNKTESGAA